MINLEGTINNYVSRLRGNAKTLDAIRKEVEKDFYKKFGLSKRSEAMAYEIADCVAERLKAKR